MLEQPDSPTASQTKKQVFDHYLYRLQSEIHTIISAESDYDERVKSLETDLTVFKRACFAAENDKRLLNEELKVLKEKLEFLQVGTQISNVEKRIVCLIDGDGTMFSTKLIAKGQEGGRLAAKQLSESVHFHLITAQPCHLWTYIFFDKHALLNALVGGGGDCKDAGDRLEEFMSGFNQSCERFVMADVGNDKEAAGAKIRASLDFHARSHETYKVVFGGCHNNRYVSQLSSLQLTSVYREKLVLLPGYTEMASEFDKLHLPSLVIPGLFIPDKIIFESDPKQNQTASQTGAAVEGSPASCGPPPGLPHPASSPSGDLNAGLHIGSLTPPPPPPYPREAEPDNSDIVPIKPENSRAVILTHSHSSTPDRHHRVILGHASGPVSYRPVSQAWSHNQLRPAAGPNGEWIGNANSTMKGVGKRRRISHDIPLSQHDPPPCTLFYLATNGCKHGPDCRFGHDYILDDEDFELMRLNARRVPCPSANRGEMCVFGDECCYGHTCPFENRCHFFKQGKCKFAGANMHQEAGTQ